MIIWTIAVVLVFLAWYVSKKDKRLEHYGNLIPGPKPWPVIGSAHHLARIEGRNELLFRERMAKEYGDVSRLWLGPMLVVFLTDPNDIEAVLKSPKEIKRSPAYAFLENWLGTGLFTGSGEHWTARRKALTPAFHFKILENFMEVFNRNTNELVTRIKQKQLPAVIDVMEESRRTFVSIICETAMGIKADAILSFLNEYSEASKTLSKIFIDRVTKFHLHSNFMWKLVGGEGKELKQVKIMHELTSNIIKEKEAEVVTQINSTDAENANEDNDSGIKKKTAFLEMMLKMKLDGSPIFKSNQDIIDETNTFFFAGHDTTTAATCFALEMLARHQSIQEQLHSELFSAIADPENLTHNDLLSLPFLDRVLKESLRLYPPAPVIGKQLVNDIELPSGYTLPRDCVVTPSFYHAQRHPKHYDNPDVFDPDNFLPEACQKRHPYAFIPFSAGPRNCIGQKFALLEFKIMIAKIVYNFHLKLPKGASENLEVYGSIVLRTDSGHNIVMTQR